MWKIFKLFMWNRLVTKQICTQKMHEKSFFVSSKYLLHTYVYLIYRYSSTNSLALYRSSSDVRHVVGSVINAKCRNRPTNVDWSHSGLSTSIRSASTLIAILIVRATLMETYGIQKLTQLFDCFQYSICSFSLNCEIGNFIIII